MKKVISFPRAVPVENGDSPCQESDGCPTERAVLQRFWREHHAAPTQGADGESLRPVAIYQVIAGYGIGVWRDTSEDEYKSAGEGNPFRRIVYATRDATPRETS